MLPASAWRGNLHQSAVQSLLIGEIVAPTSAISLLSASSNGLLVETRLHQAEQQVQELHHSLIFDGGRRNPVFCLLAARDLVFAGMARNEVRAWRRSDWSPVDVDMKGHTGWVRGIAVRKNLLFTAACNFVKVWELRGTFDDDDRDDDKETGTIMDVSYIGDLKLFKGDILALALSSDHLYCGSADGFLHSWQLPTEDEHSKLRPSSFTKPRTVRAHDGRITSLLFHEGTLYSAGKDGYVRSWSTDDLGEISRFAAGQKLRALVAGPGRLFFAGDEALGSISPSLSLNGLQTLHRASTKSLAGNMEMLASGAADGEVRLWNISALVNPR